MLWSKKKLPKWAREVIIINSADLLLMFLNTAPHLVRKTMQVARGNCVIKKYHFATNLISYRENH